MKQLKEKGRRGLALFLAMVMCLSMLQLSAFAAEDTAENTDAAMVSTEDIINEPAEEIVDSADESSEEVVDEPSGEIDDGSEDMMAEDSAGENEKDSTDEPGEMPASEQDSPAQEEATAPYEVATTYVDDEGSDIIEEYIALAEQLPKPADLTEDNILNVKKALERCLEIEDYIFYGDCPEAIVDRYYEEAACWNAANKVFAVQEAYEAYVTEHGDPEASTPSAPVIVAVDEDIDVILEDGLFTITGSGTFTGEITVNGIETTVNEYAPGHITDVKVENVTLSSSYGYLFEELRCLNSLTATNVAIGSDVFKGAFAEGATVKLINCRSAEYFYSDAFANNSGIAVHLEKCDLAGWLFSRSTLTELTVANMELGKGLFADCTINGDVDLSTVTAVRKAAFDGTDGTFHLFNIPGNIPLEHSHSFNFTNVPELYERMLSIQKGKFSMPAPKSAESIAPQGWTSANAGKNNEVSNLSTQITEEAKWSDNDSTMADVLFQAYCTDVRQMDFVFVMDCSNSMSQKGDAESLNARFYSMQSKVADVAEQLLDTSNEYDCRVAFVGFGGDSYNLDRWENPITYQQGSLFTSNGFLEDADEASKEILNVKPYDEYTNFDIGLNEALKLVKQNQEAGRGTTVILISDGKPEVCAKVYTHPDTGEVIEVPDDCTKKTLEMACGVAEADAIKAAGAQIIGVLQSVPECDRVEAEAVMGDICTAGKYFLGDDVDGFSEAVNEAIYHALKSYTMSWQVNPSFSLDESTLACSEGTSAESVSNDEGTFVIWTLSGQIYELQTLNYQLNLRSDLVNVIGSNTYDVNNGVAVLSSGGGQVNSVETPRLSRVVAGYTVTYTDGVDGVEVFADQISSNLLAGTRTPAFNGTPAREGYTFEGWFPEVAETVTGDVIYTAQWAVVPDSGPNTPEPTPPTTTPTEPEPSYTPDPTPSTSPAPTPSTTPVPSTPVVDVPEEEVPLVPVPEIPDPVEVMPPTETPEVIVPDVDVPLAETPEVIIPDADVPLAETPEVIIPDADVPLADTPEVVDIPEQDVPLAEVPKTGDSAQVWVLLAIASGAGLAWLTLGEKKRREDAE